MEKTVFEITKMDCPSEENLIRMKLDGITGIEKLEFDIPHRKLTVFHNGQIEQIEKLGGASDDDAKDAALRAVDDMKKLSKYPSDGMPTKKEPEEIMDILHELDSMFEMEDEPNND